VAKVARWPILIPAMRLVCAHADDKYRCKRRKTLSNQKQNILYGPTRASKDEVTSSVDCASRSPAVIGSAPH
jgi:hypothetical protein